MMSPVESLYVNGWRPGDGDADAWLVHPVLLPQTSVDDALAAQAAYDRQLFASDGYVDAITLLPVCPAYPPAA